LVILDASEWNDAYRLQIPLIERIADRARSLANNYINSFALKFAEIGQASYRRQCSRGLNNFFFTGSCALGLNEDSNALTRNKAVPTRGFAARDHWSAFSENERVTKTYTTNSRNTASIGRQHPAITECLVRHSAIKAIFPSSPHPPRER
jgi:hypothetical protein